MTLPAASVETARTDRPASGGGPDIFGSVALAVATTPLDGKWRRGMAGNGGHRLARWTGLLSPADGRDPMRVLDEVNRWVNARVRFVDDIQGVGQADQWAGAAETLRRAQGDCEDFALAKLQLLAALGFDADRLYLVIARDLVRRADHAVLVVRLDDRFVVLDNMTDEILDSNDVADYRPVMSYSAFGRWVHGYERPFEAPIQLAANVAP
jgi:predicted transglutaminase-like cysteine proteinase